MWQATDMFIEVNTGDEKQKSGVSLDSADQFIEDCRSEYGLPIEGLMCIPPAADEPSLHFALLRQLAARNGLTALSMGMSRDYEVAVAFGATHVRVGDCYTRSASWCCFSASPAD